MSEKNMCKALVWSGVFSMHGPFCMRWATTEAGYCKQHDAKAASRAQRASDAALGRRLRTEGREIIERTISSTARVEDCASAILKALGVEEER